MTDPYRRWPGERRDEALVFALGLALAAVWTVAVPGLAPGHRLIHVYAANALVAVWWIGGWSAGGTRAVRLASSATVPSIDVGVAPFARQLGWTTALWGVTTGLLLPPEALAWDRWLVLWMTLVVLGGGPLLLCWRLGPRAARVAPLGLAGGLATVVGVAASSGTPIAWPPLASPRSGQLVLAAGLGGVYVIVVWLADRWARATFPRG